MAGTHNVHGAALGEKEVAAVRAALDWSYPPFEIPADVYQAWDAKEAGAKRESDWNALFAGYTAAHPAQTRVPLHYDAGDRDLSVHRGIGGGVRDGISGDDEGAVSKE